MKKLFALPLQGVGTVDVESLSSYLMRLASAHGQSLKQFLRFLVYWSHARTDETSQSHLKISMIDSATSLSAPNGFTARLLEILESASPVKGLRSATLLPFSAGSRRMKLYTGGPLRWCPRCMAEWAEKEGVAYFKLAWMFNEAPYCHQHLVRLIEHCPNCGGTQKGQCLTKCLSKCARCGASLAATIRMEDVVPTKDRTAADVFHLVEQIALNPDVQFFDDGVRRILRRLDRQANSCEDARSVFNAIFPVYWQQMGEEPRLLTFRETRAFSAITGISLFDVLRGNCIGQTRTISYAWSVGTKNQWQAEKRKRQDLDVKKKELSNLLVKTKGTYPSLKSVARSLGVSVGYLNYRFKSTALKITGEYQDYKKRESDRKRLTARRAAIQYFARTDTEGGIKSRKGALRELRVSTGLSKGLLRSQIADVFERRQLKCGAASIVPMKTQGMGISGTV